MNNKTNGRKMSKQGFIKWYDPNRRYGFVQCDKDGCDYFLHKIQLEKSGYELIEKGVKVEFNVDKTKAGRTVVCSLIVIDDDDEDSDNSGDYPSKA